MKVKSSDACLFVVCDECGLRSPVVMTYMCTPEPNGIDAMFALYDFGWRHWAGDSGLGADYCPECDRKRGNPWRPTA